MAFLGKAAKFLLGGVAGLLLGSKKKQITAQPQPLPQATRDDAASLVAQQDALARRRGSAADMILNGNTGAEAALAPGKLVLGN